ncbi:MAG: alpha/beta fold hydrolase [Pseudonocardiales bacterium]|nr:alpha/beta fold hydrolase [Pseudonocardiales bacterium]
MRVRVRGSGPPLLMLMGLGGSIELWEPLADRLAGHRRLIMFDTPGFGGASRWRYPVGEMSAMAGAIARETGHERLDVLGVSLGGLVAQDLARRAPDLVRRLVLLSTCTGACRAVLTADPLAMAILGNPVRYLVPPVNKMLTRYMMGGRTRRSPQDATRYDTIRQQRRPSIRGYYAQMLGTVGFVSRPWLHTLVQPTLVLHGTADPLIDVSNARLLADRIPHGWLETIDGGGHLILFDQAGECATAVEAFLRPLQRGGRPEDENRPADRP